MWIYNEDSRFWIDESLEFEGRVIPIFHQGLYNQFQDLERCPYPPFRNHPKYKEWNDNDDKRMLLIALDRFADKLQKKEK